MNTMAQRFFFPNLMKISCHAERSEASRMRPRGCSRDPSLRSG